jgi:hypothetical protein
MIRQIVIRRALRGHDDTPFRWPTHSWPIGHLGVGYPQGVFSVFSYYWLVILFLNMVCLTVALAPRKKHDEEEEARLNDEFMHRICMEDPDVLEGEFHDQADNV